MRWWKDCEENHTECQIQSDAWLPTRLLDLYGPPKLVATSDYSTTPAPPYVALSHRWGSEPEKIFKLESSNESELMNLVPLEKLSRVFLDAIKFTRRVGIRYLWIDSLCIMQDSVSDWKAEAALISQVYANCVLNITADPTDSTVPGMFRERAYEELCYMSHHEKTIIRQNFHQSYILTMSKNFFVGFNEARSLQRRAWVFQEHLLSPRTVHFSDQVFWECRRMHASETFPRGDTQGGVRISPKHWKSLIQPGDHAHWYEVLRMYLKCELTFPSDRFIAIGAVAMQFGERLQTQYCAGLWQDDMPSCLLWCFGATEGSVVTRQTTYRCPTWSWASLDIKSAINFHDATMVETLGTEDAKKLVRVVDVKIESPFGNVYTDITSAELLLNGRIGLVDSSTLADCSPWCGPWTLGYILDLGPDSVEDLDVYLLPLVAVADNETDVVHSLLLKASPGGKEATYERVGLARFSRELCPEELLWTFDMFDDDYCLEDLPHQVTLV